MVNCKNNYSKMPALIKFTLTIHHSHRKFAAMTIQEATYFMMNKLRNIYPDSEVSQVTDWVMEHLTGSKKAERMLYKNSSITDAEETLLRQYAERLLQHEPVQYVLNESWFYGLKFYVDKNVLIPRPETEELVDWIIRNLKFPFSDLKILDIGTGSGCIAIALKRKLRKAEVWACDISSEALNVARQNSSKLQAEINYVQLDFLNKSERNQLSSFDIIVSNPPYVPDKDKTSMNKNVVRFEPHMALFVPDNNALVFYSAITDFAKTHLKQDGTVYCEIHENLGKEITDLFSQSGFTTDLKIDMQGKDRMIKALKIV
jgi:release factor glutamine methyltransferase